MKKLALLLAALTGLVMSAAEITLAENGRAKAVILVPANARPIVKFAAKELAEHLKAMTGAAFQIGEKPGPGVNICLGSGDAAKFAPDEYVIKARGNRIDIYGKDTDTKVYLFNYFYDNPDKGTLRGVYNFLDSLGVRWLAPGKDGVHVPVRRTLRIPEQDIRFKPHFQDRQIADAWNFMKYPDAKEYAKDVRDLFLWGIRNNVSTRGMVNGCHSERSLGLFKNPEWLAHPTAHQLMKDGKRNPNYSCWTDPFTKEIWKRAVDGYFSGKSPKECGFGLKGYLHSKWPNPFISPNEFMIDPMDHSAGNDGRCRCKRCEDFRKKHPYTDDTEIIWQVIGEIADHVNAKYPACYISTLIYPPKRSIPETIQKPKNIRVRICLPGPRSLLYPKKQEKDMTLLRNWGDFLGPKNLPLWVYQCNASHGNYLPGIPDTYPHLTAKFIRMVRPLCAGMFCENHNVTHTYRNLDVYIFMRLIWNPERDVEKELDEYFNLYYGPAAAPAKELFARLETNWLKLDPIVFSNPKNQADLGTVRKDGELARKLVWSQVYTADEMKEIDGLLAKILRLSPASSVYARRAELLRKYLIEVMKSERGAVMDREEQRQSIRLEVPLTSSPAFPAPREWERAPEYQLIQAEKFKNGLAAGGSFRILASKEKMFILANMIEPSPTKSKTDKLRKSGNTDIWRDSCIELFFYAEKSKKFWQIIINDNGAWSSQTRGRVLMRWKQMNDAQVQCVPNASGWMARISIPMHELKTDRTDLRFNFTRERNIKGHPTEYSTWSPLARVGTWHSPDNYGTVKFER